MKRAIGFSTGVLHPSMGVLSSQVVDVCKALGGDALEIGCLRKKELSVLTTLNAADFSHLSLHAPTDLKYGDNDETRQALRLMIEADERFHFDLVVIHPEAVVDWSLLKNSPLPIGIENADWRKDFGKTVKDLAKIFQGTDFGFVLDVNHCFSIDPSMKLAAELMRHFSDRLREVHLSGFQSYHEPICVTQQEEILRSVPNGSCPIILEAACLDVNQAREELKFVTEYFS